MMQRRPALATTAEETDDHPLIAQVEALELRLVVMRRARRRRLWPCFIASCALVLISAVQVADTDLEILPNVVGGNPNDSYMLKLIGDGNSGADRAMSLHTVATTDSNYRLAISDNSGTERVSITNDGDVGIGDTAPDFVLDVAGDSRLGWHGDPDRIKILPQDFLADDDDSYGDLGFDEDGTNTGVRVLDSDCELYAFIAIPNGYEATHVRIYGSSTDTVTVFESEIDDGIPSSSLGSAATGTEIDITDTASTSTNYLVIQVSTNSTSDLIYGGYVTIDRQ